MFKVGAMVIILIFTATSKVDAGYCKVISSPECIESGNKDVGGFTVYKSCWQYQSKYVCYNDNYADYCKSISPYQVFQGVRRSVVVVRNIRLLENVIIHIRPTDVEIG